MKRNGYEITGVEPDHPIVRALDQCDRFEFEIALGKAVVNYGKPWILNPLWWLMSRYPRITIDGKVTYVDLSGFPGAKGKEIPMECRKVELKITRDEFPERIVVQENDGGSPHVIVIMRRKAAGGPIDYKTLASMDQIHDTMRTHIGGGVFTQGPVELPDCINVPIPREMLWDMGEAYEPEKGP